MEIPRREMPDMFFGHDKTAQPEYGAGFISRVGAGDERADVSKFVEEHKAHSR